MSKALYIAEKPSVAQEFAKALTIAYDKGRRLSGESEEAVVTWCVGHLVTMSYPEAYDPAIKNGGVLRPCRFLPKNLNMKSFLAVAKQFKIVKSASDPEGCGYASMSVPTPGGRENTFIVWWSRWPA